MDSLRTSMTIALYEARILWRSWFFRIFAGVTVLLLIAMNSMLLSVGQFTTWVVRAIPANIPYANMMFLNLVQSIVAVVTASDFMKRDRTMDTTEVVYIRSMTNTSYVLGKAGGNLLVFIGLNVVVMLCAGLFNFFSGDVPLRLNAYLYYAVLISLPTLVFSIGLTFCLMSIIRSQPLSLIGLFGFLGLGLFFLSDKLFSLFDFAALRTPLMFSDFTGFGSLSRIVTLRAMYLLLGVAFVLIAALRLKRLPQSRFVSRATLTGVILFGGSAVIAGFFYVNGNLHDQRMRSLMIEQHNRQFEVPCVSVIRDSLTISCTGSTVRATARLTVCNQTDQPVDQYQFRLNPGLAIEEIRGSHPMTFRRSLDYVFVKPSFPLPRKSLDTLLFSYAGAIDESACYPDIPAEEIAGNCKVFFFRKQPRYAFVGNRYVLLTPESQFYPQAGAGYCSDHPEVNFTTPVQFSLRVIADPSLTVISQGEPAYDKDGVTVFHSSVPMPGISVVVGAYAKRSVVVDSIDYTLFTLANHTRFESFFKDLGADTVASLIRGLKADFENRLTLAYPYPRFTVVEVPLQFTDFPRVWTAGHEALQPEITLLPENGFSLSDADFQAMRLGNPYRRGGDQEVLTPQEQQSMMFRRFATSTFLRDNADRRILLRPADRASPQAQMLQWLPPVGAEACNLFIFPEYFSYMINFNAPSCPVFSLALESYFKKRASGEMPAMARMFTGGTTTDERVNIALQNSGFNQICKDPRDRSLIPDVAEALGEYLFTVLQKNIGDEACNDFMQAFVAKNRFGSFDLEKFCGAIQQQYKFDFHPYLQSCYLKHPLPGYLLDKIDAAEVRDKTANRYMVRFRIANPESVQGLVKVSVRTGSIGGPRFGGGGGFPGNRGGGGGGGSATIDRIVALDARQCKEIDMMMDQPPRMLSVNTLISKNIPATVVHAFDKVDFNADLAPSDSEKVLNGLPAPEPGVVIVDDEDSGFSIESKPSPGILNWFNHASGTAADRYAGIRFFDPPDEWTEASGPQYYGEYVHSVHYIKAGSGSKRIAWKASIGEGGTYEIYAYCTATGFQRGNGRRQNRAPVSGTYHYIIHHDDGIENAALDFKDVENGWNSLGRYHLSPGMAVVELTDQGNSGMVMGDAIKWVKE